MALDLSTMSIETALSAALKSEIEAEKAYGKIRKKVNNFVLKEKLHFLASEEKKHHRILEALYRKMFKGKDPEPEAKSITPRLSIALSEEMSVPDLLELAMDAEKLSEEFYDELSTTIEDKKKQELFQYLAHMEHGHYFLVKGEYELCMKDDMYTQREDFQYDMVHIGP
jgi:rubrerythrin